MSCAGTIAPNTTAQADVQSSSGLFKVTCGGSTVGATIRDLGGGNYSITVDAQNVTCPGPLKIETKDTEGVWIKVKCWEVSPCD